MTFTPPIGAAIPPARGAAALSAQDAHILRERVRRLVTPELIERARAQARGPYDQDIAEVLAFVRRSPDPRMPRYAIVTSAGRFFVAARPARPGEAPEILGREAYRTRDEAEHAVLLRRLGDYGVAAGQPPRAAASDVTPSHQE